MTHRKKGAANLMATFKKTAQKTAKKTAKKSSAKPSAKKSSARNSERVTPRQQAEHLSRSISESAQQIWLAGVGAFGRAQAEGTKLFEGLVKEGLNLEQHARKFAGGQAEVVREVVESKVEQARERAVDTWDRLEKVFEQRVHKALVKLDVPGRSDVANLSRRVDGLTAELRRTGGKADKVARAPAPKAATKKAAAKRSAAPAAASKATVKKPAVRKSARKAIATPKLPITP